MRPMDGYPQSTGASLLSIFPHAGPTSYAQMVEGVAPALSTLGDTVQAIEAGITRFATCIGGLTDSGKYRVEILQDSKSGVVGTAAQAVPTVTVRALWIVVASGAQVSGAVNLSAEIVRLTAIGYK